MRWLLLFLCLYLQPIAAASHCGVHAGTKSGLSQGDFTDLTQQFFPHPFAVRSKHSKKRLAAMQNELGCVYFGPSAVSEVLLAHRQTPTQLRDALIANFALKHKEAAALAAQRYAAEFPNVPEYKRVGFMLQNCLPQQFQLRLMPFKQDEKNAAYNRDIDVCGAKKWNSTTLYDIELDIWTGFSASALRIFIVAPKKAWVAEVNMALNANGKPANANVLEFKVLTGTIVGSIHYLGQSSDTQISIHAENIPVNELANAINRGKFAKLLNFGKQTQRATYLFEAIPMVAIKQLMVALTDQSARHSGDYFRWQPNHYPYWEDAVQNRGIDNSFSFEYPQKMRPIQMPGRGLVDTYAMAVNLTEGTSLLVDTFWPGAVLGYSPTEWLKISGAEYSTPVEFGYHTVWLGSNQTSAAELVPDTKPGDEKSDSIAAGEKSGSTHAETSADCPVSKKLAINHLYLIQTLNFCFQNTQAADKTVGSFAVVEPSEKPSNPLAGQARMPEFKAGPVSDALLEKALKAQDFLEVARQLVGLKRGADKRPLLTYSLSKTGFFAEAIALAAEGVENGDFESIAALQSNLPLRQKASYALLSNYASNAARYRLSKRHAKVYYTLPSNFAANKPQTVIFAMHGYGSVASDFAHLNALADATGAIIVAVSGTEFLVEQGGYSWAENAGLDQMQLRFAEEYVLAKLPGITVQHRLLFGFSQGAQMALEVAAQFPERFVGAAAFSPGTLRELSLAALKPGKTLQGRSFLISVNTEHPMNIAWSKADQSRLKAAGAQVRFRQLSATGHSVPSDFVQVLSRWSALTLKCAKHSDRAACLAAGESPFE
jgi:predicted esterase